MKIDWIQIFISLILVLICLSFAHYLKVAFHVWKMQGTKELLKQSYKFFKKKLRFANLAQSNEIPKEKTVHEILYEKFPNIHPVNFLKVNANNFRLNIITDSLKKNSYFGGVATSLILATLFSNKFNIPLRIITRFSDVYPKDFLAFLELMKIPRPKKIEFFSDFHSRYTHNAFKLDVSDKDIFLSTSWWSSQVVKSINYRYSFFYILQEVENFFYPNGDEQCMNEVILNDPKINYILNSKMLYDYYEKNNYENVLQRSITFEPAFPEHIYFAENHAFQKKDKRKLFFYARPNNNRNLFYTGLSILDEAITTGLIGKEWDVYFAGSNDIPPVIFSNGFKPQILAQLDWKNYLEFIKTVDLCLSLMHTPHPSYIPLDIAATGGVVLTNRYATKHTVPHSQNIICENLDNKSLLKGFEEAIKLSLNSEKRYANYSNNRIEKNWDKSFEHVLTYMYEKK